MKTAVNRVTSHQGFIKKSYRSVHSIPFFHSIPLQLSNVSSHKNFASDMHVVTFVTDMWFCLVDKG